MFFDEIKKTIVGLGSLFTDITVERKGRGIEKTKDVSVELVYASKQKWYKKYNRNKGQTQTVLPVISIYWDGGIDTRSAKQRRKFGGFSHVSPEFADIVKKMENPVPVDLNLQLFCKCSKYSDLRYILKEIYTMFKPDRELPINMIPQLEAIVKIRYELESVSVTIENELGEEDDNNYEFEMSFTAETFFFPQFKDIHLLRMIKMLGENGAYEIGYDKNADDISELDSYQRSLPRPYEVLEIHKETTQETNLYRIELDLVQDDEIKVQDSQRRNLPFVIEYDNGECYASDAMKPTGVSASKTKFIYVNDIYSDNEKDTKEFRILSKPTGAYNFQSASEILFAYDDFTLDTLQRSRMYYVDERDVLYIANNAFFAKGFGTEILTLSKIYSKESNSLWREMGFEIASMTRDDTDTDNFLGGVADGDGFFVAIMTDSTDSIKLVEIDTDAGTQIELVSFVSASPEHFILTREENVVTLKVDGVVKWTGSFSKDVNRLWLGANLENLVGYEFYKGF